MLAERLAASTSSLRATENRIQISRSSTLGEASAEILKEALARNPRARGEGEAAVAAIEKRFIDAGVCRASQEGEPPSEFGVDERRVEERHGDQCSQRRAHPEAAVDH